MFIPRSLQTIFSKTGLSKFTLREGFVLDVMMEDVRKGECIYVQLTCNNTSDVYQAEALQCEINTSVQWGRVSRC
ncbi:hypothetical protein X798_01435 [Onchocerca flexuosa]|uniref:Uncharacterized protein n=1 Tax=Onchocerca flexuosa TaxID=387005 RepID=A0A238C361_9BILA|nr:hypothetical protein X798_01435 [Onchocerca flexuosa]